MASERNMGLPVFSLETRRQEKPNEARATRARGKPIPRMTAVSILLSEQVDAGGEGGGGEIEETQFTVGGAGGGGEGSTVAAALVQGLAYAW